MPFSREESFLLEVSTPSLTPTRLESLEKIIHGPLDWTALVHEADLHGVAPLIYHHILKGRFPTGVPAQACRVLEESYARTLAVNICLLEEFEGIANFFEARGIPLIALKGIHYADCIYPSVAVRPMTDIDILVKEHDLPIVHDSMGELGFRSRFSDLEATYRRLHFHIPYIKNDSLQMIVEIHWNLVQESHIQFDMESIWRESMMARTPRKRIPYRTLSPVDAFCFSAVHNAHNFSHPRLIWLTDLVALLQRHKQDFKKDAIHSKVDEQRLGPMFYFSMKNLEQLAPKELRTIWPFPVKLGLFQEYLLTSIPSRSGPFHRGAIEKPFIQLLFRLLFIRGLKERMEYMRDRFLS